MISNQDGVTDRLNQSWFKKKILKPGHFLFYQLIKWKKKMSTTDDFHNWCIRE